MNCRSAGVAFAGKFTFLGESFSSMVVGLGAWLSTLHRVRVDGSVVSCVGIAGFAPVGSRAPQEQRSVGHNGNDGAVSLLVFCQLEGYARIARACAALSYS